MRKGLHWGIALLLASNTVANAQQVSTSLPKAITPEPILTPARAPDLSTPGMGCPELTGCCCPQADRPLRFWVNADYLLWRVKSAPFNTPLVTTGSVADVPPGALGQPGTQVLYGDHAASFNTLSGVRLNLGIEFAPDLAVEGSYFLLQRGAAHFNAASDANGNPVIARPFFNSQLGVEDSFGTSTSDPRFGPFAGATHVTSYTQLQGWELNLSARRVFSDNLTFVALGGFRSLNLNEELSIQDNLTPLAPGVLTFLGGPANPPSTIADIDRFHTGNTFYGGQVGGRLEWHQCAWSVSMVGKVALGVTQQVVTIDGSTTLTTPGIPATTVPGGILAQPTNIGHHYHSAFSVVPEGQLNLGWNVTPRIKTTFGYTFMYWSNVVRPGNQIDRNINQAQVPTSQLFGNAVGGPNTPAFNVQQSGFWAQGLNFGIEFKF